MKKKSGCEVEVRCLSYMFSVSTQNHHHHHLRFWRRGEDETMKKRNRLKDEENQSSVEDNRFKEKYILKNISFIAKPYEILAIVGPSGAGKTTLLEILAGKLSPVQSPSIFINQNPMNKVWFKKISGYVTQKDTLFPLLTVEETLMFNAKLRLRLPSSQLNDKVRSLIDELGLNHVVKSSIGDEKVRGISGGEKRRVSIGVDVIHDPRVLILDEPTSGLDSRCAFTILEILAKMAKVHGRTIILSIHQPNFRIVKLFDSILLMTDGTVLYHGTSDQLHVHLRSAGLQAPKQVNVVEFAIDSIEPLQEQRKTRNFESYRPYRGTLGDLSEGMQDCNENVNCYAIDSQFNFKNTRLKEISILSHRFSKNILRTKELFALKTAQMTVAGLLLGSLFHNLKNDRVGAEEKVGLFAFILTFLLSCTTEGLPIFLQEKEILMKETACGSYRISSYVLANGLVFLPFLLVQAIVFAIPLYWLVGLNRSMASFTYFLLLIWLILYTANSVVICFSSLAPNFIVGNSIIQGVMGAFFLFSGYFISKNGIPGYWIFMNYLSLFKYPFEGFLVNEFSGSEKCLFYKFETCVITANDVLREKGMEGRGKWKNVFLMVCLILGYRILSYVFLRCKCSQRCLKNFLI